MRDFKGMKRQRGRNRGGNSGGGGGGGGGKQNANRAFDSNGPDNVKIRGHAQHVYEKYQQLARDASGGGDRVLAENYLQHAEHYYRVLRTLQPQRPVSEFVSRDNDIDFDEEAETQDGAETAAANSEEAEGAERGDRSPDRGDYRRDDRDRGDREARFERQDRERPERERSDRDRGEQREGRRERFNRDDRPREDRPPREERQPREPRNFGAGREEREPVAAQDAEPATLLRSEDGGVSHAPAFLQSAPAAPAAAEEGERRPRTRSRRRPRSFEPGEGEVIVASEGED